MLSASFIYAAPIAFAIALWWFATGLVLWTARLPERLRGASLTIFTILAVGALVVVAVTHDQSDLTGVYAAFIAAIVLWGWHEITFLYGLITGPRKTPCPPGLNGTARFKAALETVLFHELAILAVGLVLLVGLLEADNRTALMTYLILWGMRISAKLNLFMGAPNIADELMPEKLAYLKSYFKRAPVTRFFVASVTVATLVLGLLIARFFGTTAPVEKVSLLLQIALLSLAIVEHWFFVVPFRETTLWSSFVKPKPGSSQPSDDEMTVRSDGTPLVKEAGSRAAAAAVKAEAVA
ncbi:MAG: putative photosynthetic complex assembly protein PuhE [Pseudomonadota bacterium]